MSNVGIVKKVWVENWGIECVLIEGHQYLYFRIGEGMNEENAQRSQALVKLTTNQKWNFKYSSNIEGFSGIFLAIEFNNREEGDDPIAFLQELTGLKMVERVEIEMQEN